MFLLDTSVVSELMKSQPDEQVVGWFERHDDQRFVTSSVVVAELLFGVGILPDGKRKAQLQEDVGNVLNSLLADAVLAFDHDTAAIYAGLAASMRADGVPVGQSDTMIAATAIQYGVSVVTRNIRHFSLCGCGVANPFTAP